MKSKKLIEQKVERLHADGDFFCPDWNARKFYLKGSEVSGSDFANFDAMIIPCASRITMFDGSVIGGDDDCIWDKDAVLDYMGSGFNLLSYYN